MWVQATVRAGDLWTSCRTSERFRVKDHDNLEMSGDNDETQTPEETAVDEKVPLAFEQSSSSSDFVIALLHTLTLA